MKKHRWPIPVRTPPRRAAGPPEQTQREGHDPPDRMISVSRLFSLSCQARKSRRQSTTPRSLVAAAIQALRSPDWGVCLAMGGRGGLGGLLQPLLGVRAQAAGLLCPPRRMLRVAGDAPWLGRLQNGGDAESTRRTNGDQSPTRSAASLLMECELLRGPDQNL